jgi:hypothetical protein
LLEEVQKPAKLHQRPEFRDALMNLQREFDEQTRRLRPMCPGCVNIVLRPAIEQVKALGARFLADDRAAVSAAKKHHQDIERLTKQLVARLQHPPIQIGPGLRGWSLGHGSLTTTSPAIDGRVQTQIPVEHVLGTDGAVYHARQQRGLLGRLRRTFEPDKSLPSLRYPGLEALLREHGLL